MPQTRLGFFALLQYIRDWPRFVGLSQAVNPSVMLAYIDNDSHTDRLSELQAALPETQIIVRSNPGGDTEGKFHLKPEAPGDNRPWIASPVDVLNRWGQFGKNGYVLNLLNEPSGYLDQDKTARLVKWSGETLMLATSRGERVCLPGWGVGHPQLIGDMIEPAYDGLLSALSGTAHYYGVHEYGPNPNGRIGRLNATLRRCEKMGIKPPRMVVTEFGVDKEHDADSLSGYRSRHWSGGYYLNWIVEQFQRVYKPLVEQGTLLGLCLFCYGNSGGWDAFDVEGDTDFEKALLSAVKTGQLAADMPRKTQTGTTPVVIPVLPQADDPRWERRQAIVTSLHLPVVIRPSQSPNDTTPNVGTIRTGDELYVIQSDAFGKFEAVMMVAGRGLGWVQAGLVSWGVVPAPPPAPKVSLVEAIERWRKAEIEAFNSRIAMFDALIQALQAQA